jgi:putative endonuclease
MFVVCCALFALSKMMTEAAEERLQKFCVVIQLCHSERSRGISRCKFGAMARDYNFWIYIVTNRNHSVLYIGVTNRLSRRIWEHREGNHPGFVADYRCAKLIYYEWYRDIRDAIARESQLKKWSRTKKVVLINRLNPSWRDLGADVLQET